MAGKQAVFASDNIGTLADFVGDAFGDSPTGNNEIGRTVAHVHVNQTGAGAHAFQSIFEFEGLRIFASF
jgi:hypothetical protein